jgi:hypothetical protein
MFKPLYMVLRHNYPERNDYPRGKLLELLGWDDLLNNSSFADTCAMRMSYALAQSGVHLAGARMTGKGKVNGRPIEPGQAALSKILRRMWGEPEKFKDEAASRAGTKGRTGVISFFHIDPDSPVGQGHIDLVEPSTSGLMLCRMECYFQAREIWFWPLS